MPTPVKPLNPVNPVKFAYWVPNVSGGLVTSGIEQRTDQHESTGFSLALRS